MQSNRSWQLAQTKGMETIGAKLITLFLGSLNVFLYVFAWFTNLDNAKSSILFILAVCMTLYRFYRWAITSKQNKKLKDLAIQEKEIELLERRTLITNHKK